MAVVSICICHEENIRLSMSNAWYGVFKSGANCCVVIAVEACDIRQELRLCTQSKSHETRFVQHDDRTSPAKLKSAGAYDDQVKQ